MRAGKIFINDLLELGLLGKVSVGRDIRERSVFTLLQVRNVKISLYVVRLRVTAGAKNHS
jgi:hypothetical protein